MALTEEQIAETVKRLSLGQFDEELDWPVCYELVRSVVAYRKLSARDFAPSSQFGGSVWTVEDFASIADEWISRIQGRIAKNLLGTDREFSHVANAARLSIFRLTIEQARKSPRMDLHGALKEALLDFPSLTAGAPRKDWAVPNELFPWQKNERSARQRAITKDEVRAALIIIQAQQSGGWSFKDLFSCLEFWTGVAGASEQSLDGLGIADFPKNEHKAEAVDSELIGREIALSLLGQLNDLEKAVLRGFIIPNGLGTIVLEKAAKSLGMSKSTLHDRSVRLLEKLELSEHKEVVTMDVRVRQAFLSEILRADLGNRTSEGSTLEVE